MARTITRRIISIDLQVKNISGWDFTHTGGIQLIGGRVLLETLLKLVYRDESAGVVGGGSENDLINETIPIDLAPVRRFSNAVSLHLGYVIRGNGVG